MNYCRICINLITKITKMVTLQPIQDYYFTGSNMGTNKIGNPMMNRSRKLRYILSFHQVPYPFPYNPFPSFWIILIFCLFLGCFSHGFPGLRVPAQPLSLISCFVKYKVVILGALDPSSSTKIYLHFRGETGILG